MKPLRAHGTCVALGGAAALLRGAPGAGKSDLALRFLYLPRRALRAEPALVADDQVILRRDGDLIRASCPELISGKLEVRGLGIARIEPAGEAVLKLIADLGAIEPPRFPEKTEWEMVLGVRIRRIALNPFDHSAPIKLALCLNDMFENSVD